MNESQPETSGFEACRIRRRRGCDLDSCVEVLAEVHRLDRYPIVWPDRPATWLTPSSLLGAWVAEREGRIVGHIALSRSGPDDLAPTLWSRHTSSRPEGSSVISRLFVSPSARGYGVGALLVSRAVQEAHDHGLHPVLDVVASDTAARALYERLGWTHLGSLHQQWTPGRIVEIHCYASPA